MKRLGMMLSVIAVLSVGVSTAAAAPEFFKNGLPHVGNTPFQGSGDITNLRGAFPVECVKTAVVGKVKGATNVKNVKIHYYGCMGTQGELPVSCGTATSSSGTIATTNLKGELVGGSESTGGPLTPVLLLEPTAAGGPFAKFKCGTISVTLTGSVMTEITPLGVQSHVGELTFSTKAPNACGEQQFMYVLGTGPCHVLATGIGQAALVSKEALTYANNNPATNAIEVHP